MPQKKTISTTVFFNVYFFFFRFLEPIFFGDYPREMHELLSSNLPKFTSEEKILLQKNKADFIGVNHYTTIYVKDCISSPCDLKAYEGNALVLATGERDGVAIGKPVRTASISVAIPIHTLLLFVTCSYGCRLHSMVTLMFQRAWSISSSMLIRDTRTHLSMLLKMVSGDGLTNSQCIL